MSGVVLRAVDSGQDIEIPAGKTTVGRGPLLGVANKCVSRLHAILEVADGSLTVVPIHINPTFYKSKGETKFVDLKKNEPKKLEDGDFISLLPNKYIFEVVYVKSAESEVSVENHGADEATAIDCSPSTVEACNKEAGLKEDEYCHTDKPSSSVGYDKKARSVLDELMDCEPSSSATAIASDVTEAAASSREPGSPSEEAAMSVNQSQGALRTSTSPKSMKAKPKLEAASPLQKTRRLPTWMLEASPKTASKGKKKTTAGKTKHEEVEESSSKPVGGDDTITSRTTGEFTVGKRKAFISSDEEDSEIKNTNTGSPQSKRTGMKRQAVMAEAASSDSDNDNMVATTSREESARKLKEESSSEDENKLPPCPYGADCYRKNRVHFQEYSHASREDSNPDSDDNRPECSFGLRCYRSNPQHKRDFKHTAASVRPKRKAARNSAKRKSVLDGDSDDNGPANAYDYNDSFLNDSSSSSSYGEESEDSDWKPGEAMEEEEEGEEEDVTELLSEARGFLRTKR